MRDAVGRLDRARDDRVIVVSATPGVTAKWLVPRLWRFITAYPEIDARISASLAYADFAAGAVIIIFDDLMKAADAASTVERQRVKDFYERHADIPHKRQNRRVHRRHPAATA